MIHTFKEIIAERHERGTACKDIGKNNMFREH